VQHGAQLTDSDYLRVAREMASAGADSHDKEQLTVGVHAVIAPVRL